MVALLKKDFFVLRKTCMIYLFMLLFYVAFGVLSGNMEMFQMLFTLVGMMLPITSISYDERAKWDKYGLSMPLDRRMIVLSKYVFTWIAMGFGAAFSAVTLTLFAVFTHEPITIQLYQPSLLFTCLGFVLADFGIPIIYHLGTEKGRYAMMGLIWGVVLIPVFLVKVFNINVYDWVEGSVTVLSTGWAIAAVSVSTVLLTLVSLLVSFAIYTRKEFG